MNYNYYDILKVQPNASEEEIRIAYKLLSNIYNPDTSQIPNAAQMYRLVSDAYEVLSDTAKRERFDFELKHSEDDQTSHPVAEPTKQQNKVIPQQTPKTQFPKSDLTTSLDKNPMRSMQVKKTNSNFSFVQILVFTITLSLRIIYEPLYLLSPLLSFLLKWTGRLGIFISVLATFGFILQYINYGNYRLNSSILGLTLFWGFSIISLVLGKGGLDKLLDSL